MEGAKLGRYQIGRLIGQGGMAAVYASEHLVLGHSVAIKILHPHHLTNPAMEQRFYNEARAMASLRHPGVVDLIDIGNLPDGRAYIIMELLDGEPLAERLKSGPIDQTTAIRFGRQLASALGAAHDRGIIHRDLKPENVFIVPDSDFEGGERVKILDFGIAKRTRSMTAETDITRTGIVIGTPSYMSPEQCRGQEIDARSDIYSLGGVLYAMVTGRPPFGDPSGGVSLILSQHLYADPTPAAEVSQGVSVALSRVIDCCLAKEPQLRFQSAEQLSVALEAVDDGETTAVDALDESADPTNQLELPLDPGVGAYEMQATIRRPRRWPGRRWLHMLVTAAAGAIVVPVALIAASAGSPEPGSPVAAELAPAVEIETVDAAPAAEVVARIAPEPEPVPEPEPPSDAAPELETPPPAARPIVPRRAPPRRRKRPRQTEPPPETPERDPFTDVSTPAVF